VGDRFLVRLVGVLVRFGGVLMRLGGVFMSPLVVARLVVCGGFVVVFSRFLVMLGCFVVSFDCHVESSIWGVPREASKHTANTVVDGSRRRFTVFTSGNNLSGSQSLSQPEI
jgi:hypothetical protein